MNYCLCIYNSIFIIIKIWASKSFVWKLILFSGGHEQVCWEQSWLICSPISWFITNAFVWCVKLCNRFYFSLFVISCKCSCWSETARDKNLRFWWKYARRQSSSWFKRLVWLTNSWICWFSVRYWWESVISNQILQLDYRNSKTTSSSNSSLFLVLVCVCIDYRLQRLSEYIVQAFLFHSHIRPCLPDTGRFPVTINPTSFCLLNWIRIITDCI